MAQEIEINNKDNRLSSRNEIFTIIFNFLIEIIVPLLILSLLVFLLWIVWRDPLPKIIKITPTVKDIKIIEKAPPLPSKEIISISRKKINLPKKIIKKNKPFIQNIKNQKNVWHKNIELANWNYWLTEFNF